jgi:hypothetical protein
MNEKNPMIDKQFVIQAIIEKIENENTEPHIKTKMVEGYDVPEKITKQDSGHKGWIPDIIADKDDSTDLYEVELNQDFNPFKWEVFSMYARKLKGTFNIVVPQKNLLMIKNALKDNNIKAKIIYFT